MGRRLSRVALRSQLSRHARAATPGRMFKLPAPALSTLAREWFPFGVHLIEGIFQTVRRLEALNREQEKFVALGRSPPGSPTSSTILLRQRRVRWKRSTTPATTCSSRSRSWRRTNSGPPSSPLSTRCVASSTRCCRRNHDPLALADREDSSWPIGSRATSSRPRGGSRRHWPRPGPTSTGASASPPPSVPRRSRPGSNGSPAQ